MDRIIYVLNTVTFLACAVLLLRGYWRGKQRLLLWSGICFAGLSVSSLLVFVDLVMFPDVDLYGWRLGTAVVSMLLLMYGLIWEGA